MTSPPFDLAQAHRWFAVEFNNAAWELIERESRSPEETERMIHTAHASYRHWLEAGTRLNHQRAENLLATAYAAAALPQAAVRHADRCLALSAENGAAQTPFDRAAAYGCAAGAYAAHGDREKACAFYAAALEHVAQCDHPEERPLFARLYPPVEASAGGLSPSSDSPPKPQV